VDRRETSILIRFRLITLIALVAIGGAVAIPTGAVAGPAEEEYKLDYPDAKGGGSKGDGLTAGPRGASAKGLAAGAGPGGSGKGGKGSGDGQGDGDSKNGLESAAATSASSDTVPEIAAENADSSFTEGGLPVLILILAGTAAGALGYLAWRRNRADRPTEGPTD
jgi:hypothetical protein